MRDDTVSPVAMIAPNIQGTKKTDVAEFARESNHVGLLCNEPTGTARLLFIWSSEKAISTLSRKSIILHLQKILNNAH